MEFGRKHLSDKFFLDGDQRKSLRNIITREIVANTLIHREFTSSYQAKFIIESDKMYVENASRAMQSTIITLDNLEPNPKNPIIAAFFRNIGYADQLGSGVRNLFRYSKYYSGQDPEFFEGDIFRIIVPLDEATTQVTQVTTQVTQATTQVTQATQARSIDSEQKIVNLLQQNPSASQAEVAAKLGISVNAVKYYIRKLRDLGCLERVGSPQKGKWIVKS